MLLHRRLSARPPPITSQSLPPALSTANPLVPHSDFFSFWAWSSLRLLRVASILVTLHIIGKGHSRRFFPLLILQVQVVPFLGSLQVGFCLSFFLKSLPFSLLAAQRVSLTISANFPLLFVTVVLIGGDLG